MRGIKLMLPPAIVTYMGYSGLGIVRSLGRRGIPVFTLDPNLAEIGMSSRFCNPRQCPAIDKSEDGKEKAAEKSEDSSEKAQIKACEAAQASNP